LWVPLTLNEAIHGKGYMKTGFDAQVSHGDEIRHWPAPRSGRKLVDMPRHHAADDYEDDPNEPDLDDADEDDGDEYAETIRCPHCKREVYEGAEQCPKCGEYLTDEESPRTGHPRWVIVTAVVMLAAFLYSLVRWGM